MSNDQFAEEPLPPDGGRPARDDRDYDGDDDRVRRRPPKKGSNTTLIIVLSVVGGVMLLGCPICIGLLVPAVQKVREAAARTQRMNNLGEVGKTYHQFFQANQRGPANQAELEQMGGPLDGVKLARDGKIEVLWNVNLAQQPQGTANVLLAFESMPDEYGKRVVLFADAHVEHVNEAEFQNLPRAVMSLPPFKK